MHLTPITGLPLVAPGDNLVALCRDGLTRAGITLQSGDLLVLAQKIVSKAENRYANLADISPGTEARRLAKKTGKDARFVELILRESKAVLRQREGLLIVEHRLGYVHANAGIDRSNIESSEERVLLLPENPDASAERLRSGLAGGLDIAIIINDSAGRAWRNGIAGFALGTAGMEPVSDRVGSRDLFGRALEVTEVAIADELAAAASILMGQGAEGVPLVHVRGAPWTPAAVGSQGLIRDPAQDLFR